MATKPNMKAFQDMPPKGGYPPVDFAKGIRPRGPPGWAIWGGILGTMFFGFYKLGVHNESRRLIGKERREARMAILPYLQAEKDREVLATIQANKQKEAEIMQGVEGWDVDHEMFKNRWTYPMNRS